MLNYQVILSLVSLKLDQSYFPPEPEKRQTLRGVRIERIDAYSPWDTNISPLK